MSEAYLGEIRMFAGDYAPKGWALCNGQLLSIDKNEALFALLGTMYGGNGQTTFALPDLQGRIPIHPSSTYQRCSTGGTETVTLTLEQLPTHTHTANANNADGAGDTPENSVWSANLITSFSDGSNSTPIKMNEQLLSSVGGNLPHENMMPTTTVSFIICLDGYFPSQFYADLTHHF